MDTEWLLEISSVTELNTVPTFSLRRSTLDVCLGGQRSLGITQTQPPNFVDANLRMVVYLVIYDSG